nr:unnamed protein product [Digitaria exilis]
MVTQMGAYFFFASGLPFLGLGSAMAAPAPPMAATAAAAAASITARRPSAGWDSAAATSLAGSCSQRSTLAALATAKLLPRRDGAAAAATAAKDAIMVSDAIGCAALAGRESLPPGVDVDGLVQSCSVGSFLAAGLLGYEAAAGEGGRRLIPRGRARPVRRRHVGGRRDVAAGRARVADNAATPGGQVGWRIG